MSATQSIPKFPLIAPILSFSWIGIWVVDTSEIFLYSHQSLGRFVGGVSLLLGGSK